MLSQHTGCPLKAPDKTCLRFCNSGHFWAILPCWALLALWILLNIFGHSRHFQALPTFLGTLGTFTHFFAHWTRLGRIPKFAQSAQSAKSAQMAQKCPECQIVPKSAWCAQKCSKVSRVPEVPKWPNLPKSAQSCPTSNNSIRNFFGTPCSISRQEHTKIANPTHYSEDRGRAGTC